MKPTYVADLQPEQSVTSFFLVSDKQTRLTRQGKPYLRLELADRTGSVEARMWDGFEAAAASFQRDDFVKVQGRVESYQGRPQVMLDRLRRAEPGEIDLADYFPHTTKDIEAMWSELRATAAGVENPWLRRLLEAVLDDPGIAAKLKCAPAAKSVHHAFLGGLLEHIISLCGLCRVVAAHYPEVDRDLLLTGAVLHDIGKIDELTYERSFGYSTAGHLLGHIVMELEIVGRKIDAVEGFPPELKNVVLHMLVSHHGQYEFGSPRLPMFREAILLHYLDDLDSKLDAIRSALASDEGEGDWTARLYAFERRLLRAEQYLRGEASTDGASAPEE